MLEIDPVVTTSYVPTTGPAGTIRPIRSPVATGIRAGKLTSSIDESIPAWVPGDSPTTVNCPPAAGRTTVSLNVAATIAPSRALTP